MFAYGVSAGSTSGGCAKVDLVTGPGNIYVATAKRLVKGLVGIDSEAGPTEVAILADDSADAAYVAADLVAEAEHDPLAAAVLITDSEALADEVAAQLDKQVAATGHSARVREALEGAQSGIVLVADLDQGVEVADAYAAEHLEIHTRDAAAVAARIRNAGAIFVGPWSPTAVGDYCAGSNHVLPTGGCACHSSGLSVRSFLKSIHVVEYSRPGLAEVAGHVVALAEAEDLPAHGDSVSIRFQD
jgi:histidinol dehydrogenase